jgi:Holliday junction resolvase RusA-like endonuclease
MKGRINVKPLSVNKIWQGRRFRTKAYRDYEVEVLSKLPASTSRIASKRLKLSMGIGVSSKNFDLDNACKPFLDILCKKYRFDDRYIYEIRMKKADVRKGKEYLTFKIGEV